MQCGAALTDSENDDVNPSHGFPLADGFSATSCVMCGTA